MHVLYNPSVCNDTHCRRSSTSYQLVVPQWLMLFSPGAQRTSTTPTEEDNRHLVVAGFVAFGHICGLIAICLWIGSYLCVDHT